MNSYVEYVERIRDTLSQARSIRASGSAATSASGEKVLIFSPHPDDECIIGLLPLRLMREGNRQIINIPVTYGSNVERQQARAEELDAACAYLGWDVYPGREGHEALTASEVVEILNHFQPEIIFLPHDADWNSRHISTHHLVMDALQQMNPDFACTVIETEFWGAMDDPNLMVEGDVQSVADLVAATSLHVGEVARNPYHLLLPAWMQDNVRRGGELVGGQGGAVPDFSFATLYRLRKWKNGALQTVLDQGVTLAAGSAQLTEVF